MEVDLVAEDDLAERVLELDALMAEVSVRPDLRGQIEMLRPQIRPPTPDGIQISALSREGLHVDRQGTGRTALSARFQSLAPAAPPSPDGCFTVATPVK
jgi:hypothetical protein